jgi:hypothetical protein
MPLPTPTGAQRTALYYPATGHTVVLGTAGSGKTTLAILRSRYLAQVASEAGPTLLVTFKMLTTYLETVAARRTASAWLHGRMRSERINSRHRVVRTRGARYLGHMRPSTNRYTTFRLRRISVGGALARAAWAGFLRAATEIAERGTFANLAGAVPFAEIDGSFAR